MEMYGEALVRLVQQCRGGVQVNLGGADVDMAQVRGERRQQRVDVLTLAVLLQQPSTGIGMA